MAYDERLADRIRVILGKNKTVTERKMFGGLCFLVNGKMACGVLKNDLVAKIGKENHNWAIAHKYVRSFNFTGKPMVGIVYVAPGGLKTKKNLAQWIEMGRISAVKNSKSKKKK